MHDFFKEFSILKDDFTKKMVALDIERDKVKKYERDILDLSHQIEDGKKSEIMFQEIAQKTQRNVEGYISDLVTLALKSVSPKFPNFVVKFVIRRKQLEADLLFEKNGNLFKPLYSSGGGPKDVASFGLIIANWSMDKTRASILLDEPFKQVSPDLQENVSEMIKMLNKELDLQFIMVSHAEGINYSADKTFHVNIKYGQSELIEL